MRRLLNLWVLLFLCGCSEVCHVKGHVEGVTGDMEVFVLRQLEGFKYDTITKVAMREGTFEFDLAKQYIGEAYELQFGNLPAKALFFAESGSVRIRGHKDSLYYSKASGTRANDEWLRYQDFMQGIILRRENEMFAPDLRHVSDEVKQLRVRAVMRKYDGEVNCYQDSLIGDGNSLAALYSYWKKYLGMNENQLDSVLMKFGSRVAQNRYYLEMRNRADVLKRIAPGAMAPVFSAKAMAGDSISLATFRGKYTILDFWASWCMPCRAETVHMKQLYQQYHAQGLEVFSVSLDKDEQAWKKAIEQDGMNWQHGVLLGENKSFVTELYGIVGIPAIWVIDAEGKILARNLRGERLQDFCAHLFESK